MPFANVNRFILTLLLTLKERARFPVFVLGVYFHYLLLKFGVLAEHC